MSDPAQHARIVNRIHVALCEFMYDHRVYVEMRQQLVGTKYERVIVVPETHLVALKRFMRSMAMRRAKQDLWMLGESVFFTTNADTPPKVSGRA